MSIQRESWYREFLADDSEEFILGDEPAHGLIIEPRDPDPQLPPNAQKTRDKFWISDILLNKVLPQLVKGLDEAGNLWGDPREIRDIRLEVDDLYSRIQEFFSARDPRKER